MDIGLVASTIACVNTYGFPKELFDFRDEWITARQVETRKCDIGGFETTAQWAGIVALWCWYLLFGNLSPPEIICLYSLGFARRR
jgi:hypothetical protein